MSKCLFCGKPSTRLCDEMLAMVWDESYTKCRVTSMEAMMSGPWSCDAPTCDDCCKPIGWISGKDPDSIDHCLFHVKYPQSHEVMSLDEIATLRRSIHAAIRRESMRKAVGGYDPI